MSLACLATAVLVRWLLDPVLGDTFPLTTLLAAIGVAVWIGGYRPALLVAALGFLACSYLFIAPRGQFGLDEPRNLVGSFLFLATSLIIIGFGEALRRAHQDCLEAESAARQQAELLGITLTSIGDGVIATDPGGRVTTMNAVAEAMTGWTKDEAAGMPLTEVFRIVNESTRLEVENPALRALKDGVVVGLANHTVLIAKDGTERPIDDSAAPIRRDDGEIVGCILVFHDISERHRAEVEQLEARQQLATTLESVTDGFMRYDRDWRIVYVNAEAERINRLTRSEMLGQILWDVFPAIVGTRLEAEYLRAVAEQVTVEFENHYEPFGRWYSLKGFPTADGGLTTYIRDITDRKRAEALLAGQKRVLETVATDVPLAEVLTTLAVVIEEQEPGLLCSIILLDEGGAHLRVGAGPSMPEGYLSALDGLGIEPPYPGPCGMALHTGEAVVVTDIEADPRWSGAWRDRALAHGLRSCRSTPIVGSDGKPAATFAVYRREPGDPAPSDPHVLPVATHLAGIVIDRKKQESALRESEARYRAIGESIDYGVWVCDAEGRNTYASESFLQLVGITQEECSDFGWAELLHPDDVDATIAAWKECARTQGTWDRQHRFKGADGGWHDILARGVPLRNETGILLGWAGINLDISRVLRAEREVVRLATESDRQQRLYETVLTNTPDFVYVFSLDHKVLYANDALIKMWGRGHEGAIGKTFLEIGYEPWHAEMHDREIDEVRATRQPIRGEVPFNGTNGRRQYDYIFVPVIGADGEVEAVAGTTRDVTERKETERQLRYGQEQLDFALAAADLGQWSLNLADRTARRTLRHDQLFGYDALLPEWTYEMFLEHVIPDERAAVDASFQKSVASNSVWSVECRIRRADGAVRHIWTKALIQRDADGQVGWMLGIVGDVTDRRQAEERQAFLVQLADTLRPLSEPTDVQAEASRLLGERLGANRVVYFEVRGENYVVERDYTDAAPSIVGRYPIADFGPDILARYEAGRTASEADVNLLSSRTPAEKDTYAALQIRSYVGVPLVKGGAFVAGLAVHVANVRPWTPAEISLIEETAERTWAVVGRVRAEAALRQSEERLRMALSAARMVAWEYDPASGAVFTSGNATDVYGFPQNEEMASIDRGFAILHPDDVDNHRATVAAAVAAGEGFTSQFRIVRPDNGSVQWMEEWGHAVRNGVDTTVRLVGINMDITARKVAEAALRQSEERSAFVRSSSGVGFWYCDLPFEVLEWDELVKAHFHLAPDAVVTIQTFYDRLHPDDREPTRLAIERSIAGRTRYNVHYRTVDPDTGDVTWVRALGRTAYAADGTPTRFDGVTLDVSDQKRAEASLRESEERLRTLFESMDEGFCVIEMEFNLAGRPVDYRIEVMNPAFEQHTGMHGLVGKSIRNAIPELEEFWYETYGRVASTGEPTRFEHKAEPMGGRWFEVSAFRIGDDGSRKVAILFNDVTARRMAAVEREQFLGQLRDADRRKDEFLATLAHELRNPLAPIRNGLQVMRLAGVEGPIERARTMMERQVTQLVRLVDDLLDVSRVTSGKFELRRELVELRAVIDAAVETSRPAFDVAGHELEVAVPDEPILLDGDSTRLAQVVSNLLTNSAKYTHPGGHVRLAVRREDGMAVLSIADNGIGIPPHMLGRIFEMFTQMDRTLEKTTGGLGIGLSLVKGLVEMHGGTIEARSEGEGRGSEFIARLPMVKSPVQNVGQQAVDEPVGFASRRILVTDDNVDSAESLGMFLELLGNDVSTANDGLHALEVAERFLPEVILLDIGMPKLNGYETCRRIREQTWGKKAILIAMTGWGQDEDKRRSDEAGFDHHLVKPVDTGDLVKLLASLKAETA
ncbi:PAS domain S-box protein [Luteolibacter arcticus]|uniref:histidine kinase n=1 Tax=Luteolibacter arcticus TaxID=1581411 RepID=A0ABT3GKA5_9BACT|nr:PAS domain S-box protein [Luteolibacter arcticus]MCW1923927.1 PAS domain S-box protein [Luteolibacter arcticus]